VPFPREALTWSRHGSFDPAPPTVGPYQESPMQIVNPPSLARPSGYSHGIVAEGRPLYLAGQVAWDAEQRVVSEAFPDQFAQALENLLAVVREAGGRPEHVVKLTAFVTDRDEYNASLEPLGAIWRRLFGRHYPAMSLVQVAGLVEAGAKVEIEGIAVLP